MLDVEKIVSDGTVKMSVRNVVFEDGTLKKYNRNHNEIH